MAGAGQNFLTNDPTAPQDVNIPVPKMADAIATPVQQAPPQAEAQSGYAGTTGHIAQIGSSILTGYLAGKSIAEQRKVQNATAQLANAKATYDISKGALENLYRTGKDDNDPDVQKAKQAVVGGWNNYLTTMQPYVDPGPDATKGFMNHLKKGFVPQDPRLMSMVVFQGMKGINPLDTVARPGQVQTAEAKAGVAQADASVSQANATQTAAEATQGDIQGQQRTQAQAREIQNQLQNEQDPQKKAALQNQLDGLNNQMTTYGGKPMAVTPTGTTALAQGAADAAGQDLQRRTKALSALDSGTTWYQLSDGDKHALGMDPTKDAEVGAYLQNVRSDHNPSGEYANSADAIAAMYQDRWSGRNALGQSRVLAAGDLQQRLMTPAGAADVSKQLGYAVNPLQPGEMPPANVIDGWTMLHYKPTPEQRAQYGVGANGSVRGREIPTPQMYRMRSQILNEVTLQNPDWAKYLQDVKYQGDDFKDINADGARHFYGNSTDDFHNFLDAVKQRATQGLGPDQLKQFFPEFQFPNAGNPNQPPQAPPPPRRGFTPPPGAPATSSASPSSNGGGFLGKYNFSAPPGGNTTATPTASGATTYTVRDAQGNTKTYNWTPQEYQQKQALVKQYGGTVTPVSN